MKPLIFHPELPDKEILKKKLWLRLGYQEPLSIPYKVRESATEALKTAIRKIAPLAVYNTTFATEISNSKIISGGLKITSVSWSSLLKNTMGNVNIAAFALTLGEKIDEEIRNARKKSLSMGYFISETGSVIIEAIADKIETYIRHDQKWQHLTPSRRFSPGYCDIPVSDQKHLYSFLVPQKIGIRLKPSGAMQPEKTIMAVILYANSLPAESPCYACITPNCHYRRGPQNNQNTFFSSSH